MADIKHLLHIQADPEKIYETITTVEGLKKWWTPQTSGDEEGVLEFRFGDLSFNKMKVTGKEPLRSIDWKCVDGAEEWIGTKLSFELTPQDEGRVKLLFQHRNWPDDGEFFATCNHIWGHYLNSLKDLCEKGKGDPFDPHGAR